jgi:hypothetical protein
VERTWYRTYVDAEGERVELSGALADDGSLVLTGSDRSRGEEVLVRMRLARVGPDEVEHTVEVSRDNGVTWRDGLVLRYRRRS